MHGVLLLALLGNVLGKVRRNFWVGVRTPWTLADVRVWERTHRLAAWLFTVAGLVGASRLAGGRGRRRSARRRGSGHGQRYRSSVLQVPGLAHRV